MNQKRFARFSLLSRRKMADHWLTLVCGTYERLLYGFQLNREKQNEEEEEEKAKLEMVIAYTPHIHAITALGISRGGWMVTGSADEVIR